MSPASDRPARAGGDPKAARVRPIDAWLAVSAAFTVVVCLVAVAVSRGLL